METLNSPQITYALFAIIILLVVFVIRLEFRMKKLMRGNSAGSMEGTIMSALNDIEKLHKSKKDMEGEIKTINDKIRKNIQKIGTVRFNPFSDVGGKQSFASAFIDSEGTGLVISSLYSRDKVSVFAKPIKNLESEYELSEEEKEALKKAWDNI